MNSDFYKLVHKIESLTEEKPEPKKLDNGKSVLQENAQNIQEKYMGWKKTVAAIKKGGSADNPEAVAAAIGRKKYGKEKFQKAAASGKKLGEQQGVAEGSLEEVAPPGAKAERMVKHIKAGYAKDGKLTDVETSKAYGAAWKAHNKGKVEESNLNEISDGPYYIVGIGKTSMKPIQVNSRMQAIVDAKAMIANGQNVQVRQGSPIGSTLSLDIDTSTMPSKEKDARFINASRVVRQLAKDEAMNAFLEKEMALAKKRDILARKAQAQSDVDQLSAPRRINPTATLAKPMEPQSNVEAPAKTWREVDKDIMKKETDKAYRQARAALRGYGGGFGVAEAKVKEAEVWRPGMPPPPNPDMGSSLTPDEQKRVVTPVGPQGVQQPYLPPKPEPKSAPKLEPKKTGSLDKDTDIAETKTKKHAYSESMKYRTINRLIKEEFDLDDIEKKYSIEEMDIKNAIGDDLFAELQSVKDDETEMSEALKDALLGYLKNSGELPPEIRRDDNTVKDYVLDKIKSLATTPERDEFSIKEDRQVKGTRYGGSAQVDDQDDEDEDGDKKPKTEPAEKRGRGRPRKDSGDANTQAKYSGATELQKHIVGSVPKKSKELEKLPTTKHKIKG